MIISDYNVIFVKSEKKGGRFFVNRKVCIFKSFIMETGLYDLGFIGAKHI